MRYCRSGLGLKNLNFLVLKNFFRNFDFENGCKNVFENNYKNAADPEIRFATKSIYKPFGCQESHPIA